jgi:hypothetical protein
VYSRDGKASGWLVSNPRYVVLGVECDESEFEELDISH